MDRLTTAYGGSVRNFLKLRTSVVLLTAAEMLIVRAFVMPVPTDAQETRQLIAVSAIPANKLKDSNWAARHNAILKQIKDNPDRSLVLIGDSITQNYEKANAPYENFLPIWQQFYAPRRALNLGVSGDTTENVLWRLDHGEIDGISPKAALILIGTNNITSESAADTESGIDAVVEKVERKLPNSHILLIGILPRTDRLAMVSEVNQYLSTRYGKGSRVTFLDVGPIFYKDGKIDEDLYYDPKEYNAAALHPDTNGQRMMAEAIEPVLARLIGDDLQKYQLPPENLKARQDFQDAKFGLFIHWGIYSILGDG